MIIAGFIVIIFTVYNLEELRDLGFRGSNIIVTTTMVLISFYLGTRNFISFNNPEKQFDPMKYSKESMFLGMFRRGSYSLFKLILAVVFCSSVAFIAEMIL